MTTRQGHRVRLTLREIPHPPLRELPVRGQGFPELSVVRGHRSVKAEPSTSPGRVDCDVDPARNLAKSVTAE